MTDSFMSPEEPFDHHELIPDHVKESLKDIKKKFPKIVRTKDDRQKIGDYINERIVAGEQAKDGPATAWKVVQGNVSLESSTSSTTNTNGIQSWPVPLTTQRVNTAVTQICSVISKASPYMICQTPISDDEKSLVEKILFTQMKRGGFEQALQKAAKQSVMFNYGIFYVDFTILPRAMTTENEDYVQEVHENQHIRHGGLTIKCIDINDFIIYPSTVENIKSASFVGRRFYLTKQRVQELQLIGEYYTKSDWNHGDEYLVPTSPITEDILDRYMMSRLDQDSLLEGSDSELIEIWEVYFKYASSSKEIARYYRAHYAKKGTFLLKCEEWDLSQPPIFVCNSLIRTIGFWDEVSFGHNLASLQSIANNVHSLIYAGAGMQSFPPLLWPLSMPEKYVGYGPMSIIPVNPEEANAKLMPVPLETKANVEPLVQYANMIENMADQISSVSANNLAAEEPKASLSATQSSLIAQGVQSGLEMIISTFTLEFPAMANFMCELLAKYYILWAQNDLNVDQFVKQNLDSSLQSIQSIQSGQSGQPLAPKVSVKDLLRKCTDWEVMGKTLNSSVMARVAAMQQLWQIAQDPQSGINKYKLVEMMISQCGLSGADKLQSQENIQTPVQGAPTQTQGLPQISGQPTMNGEMLPPNEHTNVRPAGGNLRPQENMNGKPPQ